MLQEYFEGRKILSKQLDTTLQTSSAVVVFPIPGGPDNRAALKPNPSSLLNRAEYNNKLYSKCYQRLNQRENLANLCKMYVLSH